MVDDAILVGENIYRHQEGHGDAMRESIEGAYEIANLVTRRSQSGLRGCVVPPRTSRLLPVACGRVAVAAT